MNFAHIGEIKEVSDVIEANQLIKAGAELVAIVPGWTADNTPCTLIYLGHPRATPEVAPCDQELGQWAE